MKWKAIIFIVTRDDNQSIKYISEKPVSTFCENKNEFNYGCVAFFFPISQDRIQWSALFLEPETNQKKKKKLNDQANNIVIVSTASC